MSDNARRQLVPGTIPYFAWTSAVDVDLKTALAISRASAEALMDLSAETAKAVRARLEEEATRLELEASPEGDASARVLRQMLDRAA